MQGPADTLNYMIAGYAVIFVILIIYLVSLVVRWRGLRRDEEMLDQIEEENRWSPNQDLEVLEQAEEKNKG